MIIELHAIQTFGPTNLNRDDTGNPKEALFGGVRRARVSSQAAKRAMRVSDIFQNVVGVGIGTRTKSLVGNLVERLLAQGVEEETALAISSHVIDSIFAKPDKKDSRKTSVLVYVSPQEMDLLAEICLEAHQGGDLPKGKELEKDFRERLKDRALAPDIALFGRMLAEHPDLNIDAACQVAHALSTHEVNSVEFDYFTAVDDLNTNEETGAGMLGLVAFNSATYYRCIRVDWDQLVQNLNDDIALAGKTIEALMQAFAIVVPTGMKNSFVNQHAPDFLLAVVRPDNDGQSLDNAFEQPIKAHRGSGYAEPSIHALVNYWETVDIAFRLSTPFVAVMNPRNYDLQSEELNQAIRANLVEWTQSVTNAVTETI